MSKLVKGDEVEEMLDSDIMNQLQGATIEERIRVIEMILKTLKQELRASPPRSVAEQRPLRGKVRHYTAPYDPVAAEDWEASA